MLTSDKLSIVDRCNNNINRLRDKCKDIIDKNILRNNVIQIRKTYLTES